MEIIKLGIHLLPVPLSGSSIDFLPSETILTMKNIDFFIVEKAKTARAMLKSIGHPLKITDIHIEEISENLTDLWPLILSKIAEKKPIGILSEAGLPAIADPGAEIVKKAHQNNIPIYSHAGPNSMLMALMCSGLNGQAFTFHGYLPAKKEALRDKIIDICKLIQRHPSTHIFMETPYRNRSLLETILSLAPPHLLLSISSDLHTSNEKNLCTTIADWRKKDTAYLHHSPTIFCMSI